MITLAEIESELKQRTKGWWGRLVTAIPELAALEGTPQPPEYHTEGNAADHTRLAVVACPEDCHPDLLWVALLHDIGKPASTEVLEDGSVKAHGHAKVGAELASEILGRVGMPQKRRDRITWVIRHHMFHHSWQLKAHDQLTGKQLRYLRHPDFPLLLEFLRIDLLASHSRTGDMQVYEFYRELLEKNS